MFQKDKFNAYRYKQKTMAWIVKRLSENALPGQKLIIVYGNGNYPTSMKGDNIASPLGSISREVSKHFPTVMTVEHNTSKLCRTCKEKLERVRIPSVLRIKRIEYQILPNQLEVCKHDATDSKIHTMKKKKVKMKLNQGLESSSRSFLSLTSHQDQEQRRKVVQLTKNYRLLKCPKHNCDSIVASLRQARRLEKGLPKCKTGKRVHTYDRDENAVFNIEAVFKAKVLGSTKDEYFSRQKDEQATGKEE